MTAFLPFPEGTTRAVFIKREKRFRVLVEFPGGERFWVHTNNSGAMLGLLRPGRKVLLSPARRPGRTLPWTLEAMETDGGWCCVNTLAPNRMLAVAWEAGALPELAGATAMKREAKTGESRLDARFEGDGGEVWVEAKNCTLQVAGEALFPDAMSARGRKHLEELMRLKRETGARVATFYLVSIPGACCLAPAWPVDAEYAEAFERALDAGVEAWPYRAEVDEAGVRLAERLPVAGR
ncbi:DNA/RNA nuclease SfsA [Desulfohalovibrio reitneri]|uniref:DNA/RNA nuclease SfsA n=1 Tax=Desulfohalovibrio reitneri TaxID=1307759 RepID=UPI0004A72DF4|nr:DNA/RNA nuclease SfsA [Desulfohalovibrio reitneri]